MAQANRHLEPRVFPETRRIALVGNSVCPHVARALVHAQITACERREAA